MGPTFVPRAQEDTGAEPAQIARAYTAAREIFDMRDDLGRDRGAGHQGPGQTAVRDGVSDEPPAAPRDLLAAGASQDRSCRSMRPWPNSARACVSSRPRSSTCSAARIGSASRKSARSMWTPACPPELAARIASLAAHNAALDIVELATAHKVECCRGRPGVLRDRRARRPRLAARPDRAALGRRPLAGDCPHRTARRRHAHSPAPGRASVVA